MKRDRKMLALGVLLLLSGVIGLLGRHAVSRTPWADMGWGRMGGKFPPAVSVESLPEPDSRGATLLRNYCAQCHGLPSPGLHSAEEWQPVLNRMLRRMDMMERWDRWMQVRSPTREEANLLLEYLQKHSRREIGVEEIPEVDTPEALAFVEVCSQCHALPDPRQHSVDEWPAVISRMKRHMEMMGKSVPGDDVLSDIENYLRRNADGGGV